MKKHEDCTALACGCMNKEHHGYECKSGCELKAMDDNVALIRRKPMATCSDERPCLPCYLDDGLCVAAQ